jgi:hypothetical protein
MSEVLMSCVQNPEFKGVVLIVNQSRGISLVVSIRGGLKSYHFLESGEYYAIAHEGKAINVRTRHGYDSYFMDHTSIHSIDVTIYLRSSY